METDSNLPETITISHQSVLSALTAMCTQESVIHEVIPMLIDHVQHLCDGKRGVRLPRVKAYYTVVTILYSVLFLGLRGLISTPKFKSSSYNIKPNNWIRKQ